MTKNENSFLFGTVGSPTSTPKKPGGTIGAIAQIKELGLGTMELGWVQSVRVTEETCKLIQETSKTNGVPISVHAPYFINLNATDEEWPKSRKRLMDAAYYGFLAGATDIIFHPGSYFNQEVETVRSLSIERLRDCAEELAQKKIDVILRPETMGKAALLGSLEDTIIFSQEIYGVLPCVDFAHLHARTGDGGLNSAEEWKTSLDFYRQKLGAESLKHLHIHISGIEYSSKGERNHLPIQESDLNFRELFGVLKETLCGGRILCESPNLEVDALFLQEFWKTL